MATRTASRKARCGVCGRPNRRGFARCFCCTTIVEQLALPLAPVVAMTEYRIGDRMHGLLRGYKDAPSAEARMARRTALATLVELWLASNADAVRDRCSGGWDLVTTVPSSWRRAGSPADALVEAVPGLAELVQPLLVRGDEPLGHLVASRRGYVVSSGIERRVLHGRRILVFDDTLTTGARAQSAAAALRECGARVAGILVVGRVLGIELHRPAAVNGAAEVGLS
jgi:predicted amidophosphoribosyltransferase